MDSCVLGVYVRRREQGRGAAFGCPAEFSEQAAGFELFELFPSAQRYQAVLGMAVEENAPVVVVDHQLAASPFQELRADMAVVVGCPRQAAIW